MKKSILLFLFINWGLLGSAQQAETLLYLRKELVRQQQELQQKIKTLQKRIDRIDAQLGSNSPPKKKSSLYHSLHPGTNTVHPKTTKRRVYYRGPRGGCYYINANGNKTYVSRSLCQ